MMAAIDMRWRLRNCFINFKFSIRNDRNLLDPFNRQRDFLSDGLPSISTGGVLSLQHQRGWIERLFSMRDICCCVF